MAIGSTSSIRVRAPSDPFERFWERTLERGVAEIAPRPSTARPFDLRAVRPIQRPEEFAANAFALVLYPKIGMLDGRHGHNAWLHELPDPVTKVTWDNYASFSPAAAKRLGVADGDVVRVTATGVPPLELPAFVQPGQHDASVAIALGYGRAGTDRFAKVGPPWFEARPPVGLVGVNASTLVTTENTYAPVFRSFGDSGQDRAYASARIDADPPLARGRGRPGAAPHRAGNDVGATRGNSN